MSACALAVCSLGLLLSLLLPPTLAADTARAQASGPFRVGVVHLGQRPDAPVAVGLRQGFKELGYTEGRDFVLEIRAARGDYAAAVQAVRELVNAKVAVLVSAGTLATKAAAEAAGGTPIVFTQVGEPVRAGFVKALARPGGNLTGFSHLLVDTTSKRLELLKQLVPSARTVLVVFDPANPTSTEAVAVARQSAKALGVHLREAHVRNQADVGKAIGEMDRRAADAVLMIPDSLVVNWGDKIIEKAQHEKLPVIFHEDTWVSRGGLASYGPSFADLGRRAARYVDRIVKGAKTADLPVEQPTRFELVVNLRAARSLDITIPDIVRLQANRLIE